MSDVRETHILELADESGRQYRLDCAMLGAAMQERATHWLRADMSHETQLKRAIASAMLRTGQPMITEMAVQMCPGAPADTFRRARGQDILEWFAVVIARLVEHGLPSQSPIRLTTQPTGGDHEIRTVATVELAARAQPAASGADAGRADAARTAI